MSILFNDVVFGPISSRRFGTSLGINVLPLNNKVCNFNCIYCECGWTEIKNKKIDYLQVDIIGEAIEHRFNVLSNEGPAIDSITFAGNGEPTMHPDFLRVMELTVRYRDQYLQGIPITVLSNAELLSKKKVIEALMLADKRVLKLDAGDNKLFKLIDMPLSNRDLDWYIGKLASFKAPIIIQSIFLKGYYDGNYIDNSGEENVNLWMEALAKISPEQVMIYTIDRETPVKNLMKIDRGTLDNICGKVINQGIKAKVY